MNIVNLDEIGNFPVADFEKTAYSATLNTCLMLRSTAGRGGYLIENVESFVNKDGKPTVNLTVGKSSFCPLIKLVEAVIVLRTKADLPFFNLTINSREVKRLAKSHYDGDFFSILVNENELDRVMFTK